MENITDKTHVRCEVKINEPIENLWDTIARITVGLYLFYIYIYIISLDFRVKRVTILFRLSNRKNQRPMLEQYPKQNHTFTSTCTQQPKVENEMK